MRISFKIDESKLMDTIESLRKEMILIGSKEGLSSPKTIAISQKLDGFIAKYHSLHY